MKKEDIRNLEQLNQILQWRNKNGYFHHLIFEEDECLYFPQPHLYIFQIFAALGEEKDYRQLHIFQEGDQFRVCGGYPSLKLDRFMTVFELLIPIDDFFERYMDFVHWVVSPAFIPIEELIKMYPRPEKHETL